MSFPGTEHFIHVNHSLFMEELSTSYVTRLGKYFRKLAAGFLCTSPNGPFPLADFSLYPFLTVNLGHEFNCRLSPVSTCVSLKLEEVWEFLTKHVTKFWPGRSEQKSTSGSHP